MNIEIPCSNARRYARILTIEIFFFADAIWETGRFKKKIGVSGTLNLRVLNPGRFAYNFENFLERKKNIYYPGPF